MNEPERLVRAVQSGRLSRRSFIRRAGLLGLSASSIAALLAACGDGSEAGEGAQAGDAGGSEAGGEFTVGFSLGTLAQRRWQFDRQYVEEEAAARGMTVLVQAAEDDERLQVSQAENLVAQGIDALILSPVNVETAAPAAAAAKQAGIPVVSYNSVVLNTDLDYWVARDNVEVGRIQAQHAVEAAPTGNYVIVSGEPGVDIAQEKTAGNMEVLQPLIDAGDIVVVSQEYHRGWDPALGLAQIENALSTTGNQLAAVLCNYDGYVLSALEALGEVGLAGTTWLSGEDVFEEVAQAIVEGRAGMSAYTDLRVMAQRAVAAVDALLRGEEPESDDTIDNGVAEIPGARIPAFAVTKDTMCEFLKDTEWLPFDTVYANVPEGDRPQC
jgi:D-xylose transport system substrate-binding protein